MILIYNQTFSNEVVALDDCHFVGCALIECILEYHGGDVLFDSTVMRQCMHVFFGPARQTVHYLQGIGLMGHDPGLWAEEDPTIN